MKKNLEEILKKSHVVMGDCLTTKVMVTGDYHIPFLDLKAYEVMKAYAKDYKPDYFIINGDLIDFFSLSTFDKNPKRKKRLNEEIKVNKQVLNDLIKSLPKKTKIVYLYGNHEARLQRFIWRNEVLSGLDSLSVESVLGLKRYKRLKYIKVDIDYWGNERGTYQLGNMLIMHGDPKLNGASYSKYSGYSAKNTLFNTQSNIIINHTHRLAKIYNTNPHETLIGLEAGCLCYATRGNWQQGFVTFELKGKKSFNHRTYYIENGLLMVDGKKYSSNTKATLLDEL